MRRDIFPFEWIIVSFKTFFEWFLPFFTATLSSSISPFWGISRPLASCNCKTKKKKTYKCSGSGYFPEYDWRQEQIPCLLWNWLFWLLFWSTLYKVIWTSIGPRSSLLSLKSRSVRSSGQTRVWRPNRGARKDACASSRPSGARCSTGKSPMSSKIFRNRPKFCEILFLSFPFLLNLHWIVAQYYIAM